MSEDAQPALRDPGRGCLERGLPATRRSTPGAWVLMGVHAVAFAGVGLLGHADSAITPTTLTLFGSTSHPLAIVLHPFGSREPAGFALILITLWSLGRSIERQCGTARLLGMYGLANLIAGTVYYGFAQTVPELSTRPLDLPVGGLAALAFAAWRTLIKTPFRFFSPHVLFGKSRRRWGGYRGCVGLLLGSGRGDRVAPGRGGGRFGLAAHAWCRAEPLASPHL